jgi:hypothetical protein
MSVISGDQVRVGGTGATAPMLTHIVLRPWQRQAVITELQRTVLFLVAEDWKLHSGHRAAA